MQTILALEFDAVHFQTSQSCLEWLRNSDYDYLLTTRGFRLRLRKKCIYLKGESRKVFTFYNNLWKYHNQLLERPEPHVVIVKKMGTQTFQATDLPEDLPSTVEREEKKAEKKAIREEKEAERREKRKQKRKREKAEKGEKSDNKRGKKQKQSADEEWLNTFTDGPTKKKSRKQLERDRADVEDNVVLESTPQPDEFGDIPDPPVLIRESPSCYLTDE
jgi:hypothetical protein